MKLSEKDRATIMGTRLFRGAPDTVLRKVAAAQFVEAHPGEVCPAKWQQGAETLKPSIDLVGKI